MKFPWKLLMVLLLQNEGGLLMGLAIFSEFKKQL